MKVLTKKYGEVVVRWEYGLFDGDRDVTKAFLEKKDGKDVKVIVLTNTSQEEAVKKVQELGVSDFVIKAQSTPHQVLEVVKRLNNQPDAVGNALLHCKLYAVKRACHLLK